MNKLRDIIMATDFNRLAKRFLLVAVCVVLVGAAVSGFFLREQIGELAALSQQEEYQKPFAMGLQEQQRPEKITVAEETRWEEEEALWQLARITEPSPTAKVAVGVTALLCLLLGAAYWFLVAAWLYQASAKAGMNRTLWSFCGLVGNLAAVAAFLVVRSFSRIQCPNCNRWQQKTSFCRYCGAALEMKCPVCGGPVDSGDRFCRHCGQRLPQTAALQTARPDAKDA